VLAAVIAGALLMRRRATGRAQSDDTSSWEAAEEPRPVPPELRRLPEVRVVRAAAFALVLIAAIVLPNVLAVDRSLKASAVLIYAILGVSLVVLTGWAG